MLKQKTEKKKIKKKEAVIGPFKKSTLVNRVFNFCCLSCFSSSLVKSLIWMFSAGKSPCKVFDVELSLFPSGKIWQFWSSQTLRKSSTALKLLASSSTCLIDHLCQLWSLAFKRKNENKEENDKERRLEEVQKTKGQMEGRIVGAKFVKERTLVGEGQIWIS